MTSSRMIQQELDARANASNPHNNQSNPTLDRLRERLNASAPTGTSVPTAPPYAPSAPFTIVPSLSSSSNSTYADTITGPEGGVYQVSGPEHDEVQQLIESLMAFNVTLGGNCSEPTRALYSTTFCQNFNATEQNPLDIQACNGSEQLPEIMQNIFNNATLLCPAPSRTHDHTARMAVASTILGLLMLLVAGLTWRAHQKVQTDRSIPARASTSWLENRRRPDESDDESKDHSYQPVSTSVPSLGM